MKLKNVFKVFVLDAVFILGLLLVFAFLRKKITFYLSMLASYQGSLQALQPEKDLVAVQEVLAGLSTAADYCSNCFVFVVCCASRTEFLGCTSPFWIPVEICVSEPACVFVFGAFFILFMVESGDDCHSCAAKLSDFSLLF